jgi:hypothetical protein
VATTDHESLTSAECGRAPREDENAEDDWRAYSDGIEFADGADGSPPPINFSGMAVWSR